MGDERTFGSYVLEERLAAGGMAEIFRARRVGVAGFARRVCIKRILPSLSDEREFVEMFIDEARTGAQLRHGNIVSIDDFGEVEGQYFLCMEYVSGVDLARLSSAISRDGRLLPFDVATYVASEVLKALDYAHRKLGVDGHPLDVVHRDVSPQNVLVSFSGEVKLTDFGIARAASRLHRTVGEVVKGKLAYMAPEQARGRPLDGRADLFALGVVFFEMLTGRRPFVGADEREVIDALLRGRRPRVEDLRADVPPVLARVVDKLLASDAAMRYGLGGDAIVDLAEFPPGASASRQLASIVGHYFKEHEATERVDFDLDALPRVDANAALAHGLTAIAPRPGPATVVLKRPDGATEVNAPARPQGSDTEISQPPTAARGPCALSTEIAPAPLPSAVPTRTRAGVPGANAPPLAEMAREHSPHDRTRTMVAAREGNAMTRRGDASASMRDTRSRWITVIAVALMLLSAIALVRVLLVK